MIMVVTVISFLHCFVEGRQPTLTQVLKREGDLQGLVPPSTMWMQGIEFSLSDLAASVFTSWGTMPASAPHLFLSASHVPCSVKCLYRDLS